MINLVSCSNCGIVFDASKLQFPESIYSSDSLMEEGADPDLGAYDREDGEWKPCVRCFHCNTPIFER